MNHIIHARGWQRGLKFIIGTLLTIFLVTFFSFLLMRFSPVDPAEAYVRRHMVQADPLTINKIRMNMGLDKPLIQQYRCWIAKVLKLDFGQSLVTGNSVLEEYKAVIPFTLKLVLLSAGMQCAAAAIIGCMIYQNRNKNSKWLLQFLTVTALSLPVFYIGTMYIELFAMRLKWIPVLGGDGISRYIHPAVCLAIPSTAFYARVLGNLLNKEMEEDYIFYAQCRGFSDRRILFRHALPHALIVVIPNFMQSIGFLVAGAGMIEVVFSFPGVGDLIINSIMNRDSPMIHAAVLFLALVFATTNLLAEFFQFILQRNSISGRNEIG